MADAATRIVYRASELSDALERAPSLLALAHGDPQVDPAYLFLRATAKRRGAVAVVVYEDAKPVGCLYAIEDRIRGARSGMFSIGDRTGAGVMLAAPAQTARPSSMETIGLLSAPSIAAPFEAIVPLAVIVSGSSDRLRTRAPAIDV